LEVGKYISLGNGIQVRKSRNETYTYYHSFRDKTDNKVKRKKLFTTDRADNKAFKKAILLIDEIIEMPEEKEEAKYILKNMKKYYFDKKTEQKHFEIKKRYPKLSEEELINLTVYKEKIYNFTKEEKRFNKAFSKIKLKSGIKFIDSDIRELKQDEIETILNKQIHSMSEKSLFNLIALTRAIINYNIQKLKLDIRNPFVNLDIKFKNIHRNRERYLNKEEISYLLNICKEEKNPNVFNCVYLSILTAGRKNTVLNIRKKDFDFENKILNLYNLKTEKYYKIYLNDEAINYFKNYLKDYDENEYVIKNFKSKAKQLQPFRALPKKIYEIMDREFNQGLNKQDNEDRYKIVNFHTLRRSVATNLALDNVSIYKIMKLLNHTTTKQTQDYLNLQDLDITADIESTHSNFYEMNLHEKELLKETLNFEEYLQFLKDDDFTTEQEISNFIKEIGKAEFQLESMFEDNLKLEDFTTVSSFNHYAKYRNGFTTYKDYSEFEKEAY